MTLKNSILLAKELIGDDERHWSLIREREANGLFVEVAELSSAVAEFVVQGTFETKNITPGSHEVAFGIKIVRGDDHPNMAVQLGFCTLQNQSSIGRMVDLEREQKNQWIEIILPIPDTEETRQIIRTQEHIAFTMTKMDKNYWPGKFLLSGVQFRAANTSG